MSINYRYPIFLLLLFGSIVSFSGGFGGELVPKTFAKNIYVNNIAGDDRASGLTPERTEMAIGPVKTIARALQLARRGDRIILAATPHPYRESIAFFGANHSGYSEDVPFVLEGNNAVLEGADPLPSTVWQHVVDDIYRFRPMNSPINTQYGMLLVGDDPPVPLVRVSVHPQSDVPPLAPKQWCTLHGWVYFRAESGKSPLNLEDYLFSASARMTGITFIHSYHVRIHDLTVRGFQNDGFCAANSARDIVLDSVQSLANGRYGLQVGAASSLVAGYSRFLDSQHSQVAAMSASKLLLFRCVFGEVDAVVNQGGQVTIDE